MRLNNNQPAILLAIPLAINRLNFCKANHCDSEDELLLLCLNAQDSSVMADNRLLIQDNETLNRILANRPLLTSEPLGWQGLNLE